MPLTISEHYRGGEIMGNAFAKMGEQYAQYKEKQRETNDQFNAMNSYVKNAVKMKVITPEEGAAFDESMKDPDKSITDKLATGRGYIQASTEKKVMESMKAKMDAERAQTEASNAQTAWHQSQFAQAATNQAAQRGAGQMDATNAIAQRSWLLPDATAAQQKAEYRRRGGNDPHMLDSYDKDSMTAMGGKPRDTFSAGTHLQDGHGVYLGQTRFNKETGTLELVRPGGVVSLVPEDAEPTTSTSFQRDVPSFSQFVAAKKDVTEMERSLRSLDRYIANVGSAPKGIDRIANKFSAGIKSLAGKGLNLQEMSQKMAQGQLEGLLGASRLEVVGGGVMTEQDALRVISALGGDLGALSNPQVVRQTIANIYSDKYQKYNDSVAFYNSAVDSHYGSKQHGGYKRREQMQFSPFMNEGDFADAQGHDATNSQLPDGWTLSK